MLPIRLGSSSSDPCGTAGGGQQVPVLQLGAHPTACPCRAPPPHRRHPSALWLHPEVAPKQQPEPLVLLRAEAVRWHRSPGPRSALSARHRLHRAPRPLTLPEATRSAGAPARLGSAELLVLKEKPNGLELFVLSDTQRAEPHAEAEVFMAHKERPFHLQCLKSSFRATCGTVLHAACPNTLCNSHNKNHIKER